MCKFYKCFVTYYVIEQGMVKGDEKLKNCHGYCEKIMVWKIMGTWIMKLSGIVDKLGHGKFVRLLIFKVWKMTIIMLNKEMSIIKVNV
jgi:hypothetical protein